MAIVRLSDWLLPPDSAPGSCCRLSVLLHEGDARQPLSVINLIVIYISASDTLTKPHTACLTTVHKFRTRRCTTARSKLVPRNASVLTTPIDQSLSWRWLLLLLLLTRLRNSTAGDLVELNAWTEVMSTTILIPLAISPSL